jgi:hypothetical protein
MIFGVEATEIIPQMTSTRNLARSDRCQSVYAAATPMAVTAAMGMAPT